MNGVLEWITQINKAINAFAWGPVMLALLIGTGVFLSIRTGFIQVRKFGYIMKHTVGRHVHAHTGALDRDADIIEIALI